MPARKKEFDLELFRKRVRLFDSTSEGERDEAIRQALHQCANFDPPLLFWEAAATAYGQSDGGSQAELMELKARLEERERQTARLADKYEQAVSEIERLRGGGCDPEEVHSFRALVTNAWSFPQTRLLLLSLVILLHLLLCTHMRKIDGVFVYWAITIVVWGSALPLFCKWTSLQFHKAGLRQLLTKWFIFFGGVVVSFYFFTGQWAWRYDFDISWRAARLLQSPTVGSFVLIGAAVLTVSRFSDWLIKTVGTKLWESQPIQVVRGCF